MIFQSIVLNNFGLFKGVNHFSLAPDASEDRNIILFTGQNGVGKSTLMEAIHLCLLGSLAIDSRTTEANYESHLYKRAYRGQPVGAQETSLELVFYFIKSGTPVEYRVVRKWRNDPTNVNEQLDIFENGKELIELNKKERNLFLRELIQPGFAKVMFFDGEKMLSLFEGNNLTQFIAETCRYLFGLNFVTQLKTDLGYYTNKLHAQLESNLAQEQLEKIRIELTRLNGDEERVAEELIKLETKLHQLKIEVANKESDISKQGRWAAKKFDKLRQEHQRLNTEAQETRRELNELYSGLGPFVFCKSLCLSLKERLLQERELEKWQHASDLLSNKAEEIKAQLKAADFLKAVGLTSKTGGQLAATITELLLAKPAGITEGNIHHKLSDADRTRVIDWIDEVTSVLTERLKNKTVQLSTAEEQIKIIAKEQQSFSRDDLIQPLLKQLQELNKEIGSIEQQLARLKREGAETQRKKENLFLQQSAIHEKLSTQDESIGKIHLAERAGRALEEYANRLLGKKLTQLTGNVLEKFNLLCRKQQYLDTLTVNPTSFALELKKDDSLVEYTMLSAGEKQLLLLSFLWAMREMTSITLPLVIDTPLARLDLQHRNAVLQTFLPAMQPQVLLIGTEMEITQPVIEQLEPFITAGYRLTFNRERHANEVEELLPIMEKVAV